MCGAVYLSLTWPCRPSSEIQQRNFSYDLHPFLRQPRFFKAENSHQIHFADHFDGEKFCWRASSNAITLHTTNESSNMNGIQEDLEVRPLKRSFLYSRNVLDCRRRRSRRVFEIEQIPSKRKYRMRGVFLTAVSMLQYWRKRNLFLIGFWNDWNPTRKYSTFARCIVLNKVGPQKFKFSCGPYYMMSGYMTIWRILPDRRYFENIVFLPSYSTHFKILWVDLQENMLGYSWRWIWLLEWSSSVNGKSN